MVSGAPAAVETTVAAGSAPSAAPTNARHEAVLAVLRAQTDPLYALLDAARSEHIFSWLSSTETPHESLYDGVKGDVLAPWAPHLVPLPAGTPTLAALVAQSWGKSWGIFLTSRAPIAEVRKHLRRFTYVRNEAQEKLYFRFYDPRVLRAFLPVATVRQASLLFRDASAYLVEGRHGANLLCFTPGLGGAAIAGSNIPLPAL